MKKAQKISEERLEKMIEKRSKRVDMKKLGDIFLALILLYFAFFGYICNVYDKFPSNSLLFVYQSMFSKFILTYSYLNTATYMPSYWSLLIIVGIGVLQAYRQDFLFYSIKYNFWTVLSVIPMSWFWYSINYQQNFFQVIELYFTSADWNVIALQSSTIGAVFQYIISAYWLWNFILLEVVYIGSAFLGAYLKSRHFNKIRKMNFEIMLANQSQNYDIGYGEAKKEHAYQTDNPLSEVNKE